MDDELYYGLYEYEGIPEEADTSWGTVTVDESMGISAGEVVAEIPDVHVDAGKYTIDVDHQNDEDCEILVFDGEKEILKQVLPKEETNSKVIFSSADNIYNLKIKYLYNGAGNVTIKRTIIYSDGKPFYYDTVVYALLIIIVVCGICVYIIGCDYWSLPISQKIQILCFISYLIFINYAFYRPFASIEHPDIAYHMARAEGIYRGLLNGQFPVELYTEMSYGRGMIGTLYPSLFLYIPAFLRLLHISMEGAFRIWLICINISACLTAYYAGKTISKSRQIALLTMFLYGFLPYRITVFTWRYSFAEALAFVFLPLIVVGLYNVVVGEKRQWLPLAIGMAGVIQSHVVSAISAAALCFMIGVVFLYRIIKEQRYIQILYSVFLTIMLNIWFIVPFLYYYTSDIDIAHDQATGDMSDITFYMTHMLQLIPNLSGSGEQSHHSVGLIGLWLVVIIVFALFVYVTKNELEQHDKFAFSLMAAGGFFLFMASKTFPWETVGKFEKIYSILGTFGFATRFYYIGEGGYCSEPCLSYIPFCCGFQKEPG